MSHRVLETLWGAKRNVSYNVQPGFTVGIVYDTRTPREVYEALAFAVQAADAEPIMVEFTPRWGPSVPLPEGITRLVEAVDTVYMVASLSTAHTDTKTRARLARTRHISGAGLDIQSMLPGGCLEFDYHELKKITLALGKLVTQAREYRVTSPLGTDISGSLEGRACHTIYGIAEEESAYCAKFTDGEAHIALPEGVSEGVFVADVSGTGLGRISKPIRFTVKKGLITKIEGEDRAQVEKLESLIARAGESARVLCELGIGTNPKAATTGNVSEDKNLSGRVHFAFGNNVHFGAQAPGLFGTNDCPIHVDMVIDHPVVYLDGVKVAEANRLLI